MVGDGSTGSSLALAAVALGTLIVGVCDGLCQGAVFGEAARAGAGAYTHVRGTAGQAGGRGEGGGGSSGGHTQARARASASWKGQELQRSGERAAQSGGHACPSPREFSSARPPARRTEPCDRTCSTAPQPPSPQPTRTPTSSAQAVVGGTASSGFVVCALRIVTKAALPATPAGLRASTALYFASAAGISAACFVAYRWLQPRLAALRRTSTTDRAIGEGHAGSGRRGRAGGRQGGLCR